MTDRNSSYKLNCIRVDQPLAPFVLAMIPSRILLETCYSIPASTGEETFLLSVSGAQRVMKETRLTEIGRYLESADAAIPNTIILGANYGPDGTPTEPSKRWTLQDTAIEGVFELTIPAGEKTASIIDGQHRLLAFEHAEGREMDLACSVYLDLPIAYHAFVFATINFNQQKVDRSLAYQLFGASLDEEPTRAWSPEKVAVFLARKLNAEEDSPFAASLRLGLDDSGDEGPRRTISLATVVDGLLSLVSSNPKRDRDLLARRAMRNRDREVLDEGDERRTPLRGFYRSGNDLAIYQVCRNFFSAAKETFWDEQDKRSFIGKTVGVQALFEVLRLELGEGRVKTVDARRKAFLDVLKPVAGVDFAHTFFQASGTGRTRIRNVIQLGIGARRLESIKPETDHEHYRRLLAGVIE